MNIQGVNLYSFALPKINGRENNNPNKFGLTMASPLSKDTVSFKGTPKGADKTWEVSIDLAKRVRKKLETPSKKVFNFLNSTFDDLVATERYPKNPIAEIKPRLKSVESIKEKTGSRKWRNEEEIIEYMTDLIGAKIVLRDASRNNVDLVLDRFITLIKSGKLELLEVENKRPAIVKGLSEKAASKYDYASLDSLRKMIDIQEGVWKKTHKGGKKQKVQQNLENDFTNANYCAVHFLFRLPGKNSATFELQLLGQDVNAVKKIDDAVYKKLDGKDPKEVGEKFNKVFAPLCDPKFFEKEENAEEIVNNAKDKFNKYRRELFLFQREKDAFLYRKAKRPEFFMPLSTNLFPPNIEAKYGISSADFDYNNLAKLIVPKKKPDPAAKPKKSAKTMSKGIR